MRTNEIKAKIAAKNRVSAYINAKAPAIFAALQPFLGQKVILGSGDLAAKVKKALEGVSGWFPAENIQVYKSCSNYSFSYAFKSSEGIEGQTSCIYAESIVYFADIRDGILTRFYDFTPHKEVFLENYLAIQEKIEQAEKDLGQLRNTLPNL